MWYNTLWLWRWLLQCQNVSHCQQQSYSGPPSPSWSCSTYLWHNKKLHSISFVGWELIQKKISVCWLKTLLSEIPWSSGGVENSSGDAESSRWSLSLPTAKTKQARLLFLILFHYNFHYVSAGPCWNEGFLYQRVCTAEATCLLT